MSARTDRVAFEKISQIKLVTGSWLESDRSQKGCFMKRAIFLFAGASVALGFYPAAAFAQTLKAVKDRGSLICGVSQGLPGVFHPHGKGHWTGLHVYFRP